MDIKTKTTNSRDLYDTVALRYFICQCFVFFSPIVLGDLKSNSHETWKCVDAELQRQIRCFPYGESSDVPRLQQVKKKAVNIRGISPAGSFFFLKRNQVFAIFHVKVRKYIMKKKFASLLFRLINANISVNEQPEWFHWAHRWWSAELQRQIRCFPYGESSDVPRLQQVKKKAVNIRGISN
jgi:hypothetical protein